MNTAAAYIRVSTDDQVEFSPDSQLKAIRKYAKEHDLILPEEFIFVDEGISGRKADKRPSFQRMIGTAKLKPKPFDVILLWKFSRFARNRQDSIVYKSMLRKQCGIDVVSISEQLSEDNTSVLIEALIEAMDEYYSLNLAEEVKRGMSEKFSRGGVVSQPPFGYRMGDGVFVPDEVTAPIVRMIFEDYLSGLGNRQIAAKLSNMGILTSKGNRFENRTVEYIISNPVYIGKLRRRKDPRNRGTDRFCEDAELVDGKHEPIIDLATFEAAQAKRAETKRIYTRHAHSEPAEYALKGLVRCSTCGATLTLGGDHKTLQCHRYAKGVCKVSHAIYLSKITKAVIDKLKADLADGEIAIQTAPAPQTKKVSVTETMIAKEQRKLERIREAYEAGIDTLEEYREAKQKVTQRLAELTAQLSAKAPKQSAEETQEAVRGRIAHALDILSDAETSEHVKNLTLRALIECITFIKPAGIIEILYKI